MTCDIEDTSTIAKRSTTWKGHFAFGWDFMEKTYKGLMVDNMGASGTMTGKIDGTKLVMTSDKGMHTPDGKMMTSRITWDWSDGKNVKFTLDSTVDGGASWQPGSEMTWKKGGSS